MKKFQFFRQVLLLLIMTISTQLTAGVAIPQGSSVYQLDNGLRLVLIENKLLPMVGVNVVIRAGSAFETFATSGMSHMLEHLLFNGTTNRTQKQLYDDVDMIGGYNNANTSNYYTNFMMVTPAAHIRRGIEIQADMLFNSTLPAEKFEKEKGIVLEEIARTLARPSAQQERITNDILFSGHALSLPVLGTYTTIEHMERDDVYEYYRNAYVPNNMIMSVIGNFNSDTMLTWIREIYGTVKPGDIGREASSALATGYDLPVRTSDIKESFHHRYYSGKEEQIQIFYPISGPLYPARIDLLTESLRVNRDALDKALSALPHAGYKAVEMSVLENPLYSFIQITITTAGKSDPEKLLSGTGQFIKQGNFALPAETVELLATTAKTDFLKNLEKPHMFGIYNAGIIANQGISSLFLASEKSEYMGAGQWLSALTVKDDPVIIIHHPAETGPSDADTAGLRDQKFVDDRSGLRVIARQNPATELAAIHLLFGQKARLESEFGADAAKYLHDCFEQRVKELENQKVSQKFGLTITANDNPYIPMDNIYLHPDFGYIRLEGLAFDLPGLLRFITGQMNGFQPTEKEFEKAGESFMRASMMMPRGNPEETFNNLYTPLVYEEELYAGSQSPITFENLKKFTLPYFNPGNLIISVVSPATPDSINNLFISLLDRDENKSADNMGYDRPLRITDKSQREESDAGGEQSYLFWGYVRPADKADIPALTALSLVLSDSIIFDVRERQGRAYRMSAGINIVRDRAMFYVRMGTRPANIDPLIPQMPGFFRKKMVAGLSEEKLQRSINQYLGRMMFRRLSSINQAYYLAHSEYFEGDMYSDQKLLDQLGRVTVKDIGRIAEKYLDPEHNVTVIVR